MYVIDIFKYEPSPLSPAPEPSPALGDLPTPLRCRSPASSAASVIGRLRCWRLLRDLRPARTLACAVISPPRSAAGRLRPLLAASRWLSARSTSALALRAGPLCPSSLPSRQIEGGHQEFRGGRRQPRLQSTSGDDTWRVKRSTLYTPGIMASARASSTAYLTWNFPHMNEQESRRGLQSGGGGVNKGGMCKGKISLFKKLH
ncbi:hypothetical protein Taro_048972 [Colocasia esculenta]|uniref:Uncharacterized protein n=1 Tax=Colocasia esculenta TaxID=4460 RepID=A0A843X9I8_COLES|nr:hypothetical protein [Colocasia esculenta]